MKGFIDFFTEYIVEQSKKMELTLYMNYSNHIGWTIKVNKKGYDMPIISVTDTDKKRAFSTAYLEMKRYMERMK